MPNNKKVFQIEINGLTQSIDAVKSLNDLLKDTENRIKRLQNAKVEVKVSGNETATGKVTVSGNNSSGNATKVQKDALSELSKLQQQISRQQAQSEALLTEEYKEQLKIKTQISDQNKEATKEIQLQARGIKDMDGAYSNTLAGQRAYLSELKNMLANTELGTDEWEKLGNEVLRVNTNVKKLEESYGVFTRNVGNYASASLGFKELSDGTKEYFNTINGLNARIKDLDDSMKDMSLGSDELKNAQAQLKELQAQLREIQSESETAGNAMEEKLGVKFQTTIMGVTYTFDDVNQGIGLLEDKLYSMAQAGDTASREFKAIQSEIVRLRNSVVSVDSAIDGMIGTSKGLRNVTSIFTGFTGIASLGQGLMGLFGGQNADLDKSIQQFTSLTMILQGLMAIQLEMNQNTTAFGKLLNNTNNIINTFISSLGKIPGIDVFAKFNEDLRVLNENTKKADAFIEMKKNADTYLNSIEEIRTALNNLPKEALDIMGGKINTEGINNLSAINSIGGFSGEDANKVQEFLDVIERLKTENPEVARQFKNLEDALNGIRETSGRTATALGGMNTWLGKIAASSPKVAKGINLIVTSLKAFAKATIVLALIQAVMAAFEKLADAATWAWKKIKSAFGDTGDILDGASLMSSELERQREKWDELRDAIDKAKGSQDAYQGAITNFKTAIYDAGKQLGEFNASLQRAEELSDNLSEGNGFWSVGFDKPENIEEFRKNYEKLMNAVQRGQDRAQAGAGGWGWWNTQEDAMEDLANAQKAVIKDFMYQINNIDFSKGEDAIKQFTKLINDEMYSSALANIDQLFPDEVWAKNLKALVDNYKSAIGMLKEQNDEIVEDTRQTVDELEAIQKKLRDVNTYNLQFTPGQWRFGYERQLLKDQYEDERKEAEGHAELLAAIDKKYYNDRRELLRKQAQEVQQINFDIQQNELDSQKEGLDKRIAQLELSRKKELNAAKQSDINVGKQLLAINKKYDAMILEEKKNFYKQVEDAAKARNEALIAQEEIFSQQDLDMSRQLAQMNQSNRLSSFENSNQNITQNITYDVNVKGEGGLNERKAYYDKLLQVQKDYIDKKQQLDIEASQENISFELQDSENAYKDRLKELEDFYKEQKSLMDDNLEQGLMTQEQYNTELENLQTKKQDRETELISQYNDEKKAITEKGENEITRIINESNQERVQLNEEYVSNMTDSLNEYYNDISSERRKSSRSNTNQLGIINYKKEKENLKNTMTEYQKLLSNIDKEYADLQTKLSNNEISFGDFKQAKEELDSLKNKAEQSVKATKNSLDNLINNVAGSVMNVINGYMNAFNDIWSMVSELRENNLDEEERRLEKQQEILDEELEAIEDAYQKQEEITQSHKDKINSIEGELENARGDRRQALIDQLAKERDAQIQSLTTEQEIQKKREQNEKKQQALEKQQEALEKKRWEQNKQNQIVQATINTFTAVTNALAVQPWFVGLALSAVALAMGMANVSKIKAQKYYADGGLLKGGPSHAMGGIPIGNTGIEVEGNEYVVNKQTTSKNLPLLEYINSQKKPITREDLINFYDDKKGRKLVSRTLTNKFAEGGILPQGMSQTDLRRLINYQQEEDTRPIVVSVVDIVNATDDLREVQVLSGLTD